MSYYWGRVWRNFLAIWACLSIVFVAISILIWAMMVFGPVALAVGCALVITFILAIILEG